jgi:folate-binding protein YgfZ
VAVPREGGNGFVLAAPPSYLCRMTGTTLLAKTTLPERAVLRVSGEDVRGFLQGLVTADTVGPLPAWAGLLTPQGKALFDFLLWADDRDGGGDGAGGDLLIDCEEAQADALARRLTMYRLRRAITIARAPELSVHWSREAGCGVPDPRLAALGQRWLAPAGEPAEGWTAHRLSLGVAEGVAEIGQDKTLWLEANAGELGGVSYTKGCYVGQENTARMHHRSKVNRRLVVLRGDGVADGAVLGDANGRATGEVRAVYPALGLAVAHLRVEHLGSALTLGGVGAEVVMPDWLGAALAADAD